MANLNTNSAAIKQLNHTLSLDNQNKAQITGVQEVITATDKGVVCKLSSSMLQISGENLRVEKLSPEEHLLIIVGTILNVKYSSAATKAGFFKKLFR